MIEYAHYTLKLVRYLLWVGQQDEQSISIVRVLVMSISTSFTKSILAGFGAAVALASFTQPALAGASEALAACKTEIISDAQLSGFESVQTKTDNIKRRGRYTSFEIKVRAAASDGSESQWVANCKARNNGKVEEMQLVHIGGHTDAQVAQTTN